MLKLCDPAAQSDEAILTELQNRVLMLAEVARGQTSEPTADQIAERRRDWEQALGAGAGLDALMARAGMSARDLQGWLRDDLRIRNYVDQRFGALPPASAHDARQGLGLRSAAKGRPR